MLALGLGLGLPFVFGNKGIPYKSKLQEAFFTPAGYSDNQKLVYRLLNNANSEHMYCQTSGDGDHRENLICDSSDMLLGYDDLILEWDAKIPNNLSRQMSIGFTSNTYNRVGLSLYSGKFYFYYHTAGIQADPLVGTVNTNVWEHFKLQVIRTGTVALYRDGVLLGEEDISSDAARDVGAWNSAFRIGSYGKNVSGDVADLSRSWSVKNVSLTMGTRNWKWDLNGNTLDTGTSGFNKHLTQNSAIFRYDDTNNAVLKDSYCYKFVSSYGAIKFSDLTGIDLIAWKGTANLYIDGDYIKASSSGTAWDIQLSNGSYLPLRGNGYDISGNGFDIIEEEAVWVERQDDNHNNLFLNFKNEIDTHTDSEKYDVGYWANDGTRMTKTRTSTGIKFGITADGDGQYVTLRSYTYDKYNSSSRFLVHLRFKYITNVDNGKSITIRLGGYLGESIKIYQTTTWATFDRVLLSSNKSTSYQLMFQVNQWAEGSTFEIKDLYSEALFIPMIDGVWKENYTEEKVHPQLQYAHNGAETGIEFPSDLTIIDRSDTSVWGPGARSDTYDSAHPFLWTEQDLNNIFVQDNILVGYKNRIFFDTYPSEVVRDSSGAIVTDGSGDVVYAPQEMQKMQYCLIYNESLTSAQALSVVKFLEKLKWKEI